MTGPGHKRSRADSAGSARDGAPAAPAAFLAAVGLRSACFGEAFAALSAGGAGGDLALQGHFALQLTDQDDARRELFLRQTYFALLARLLAWRALAPTGEMPHDAGALHELLDGRWFAVRGLAGFPGDDGLLAPADCGDSCVQRAARALARCVPANPHPAALPDDALQDLYEQLLSPPQRRALGEFNTPAWLAARVVARAFEQTAGSEDAQVALTDPTCGCGAFLAAAIRHRRGQNAAGAASAGSGPREALEAVLCAIHGADVNPLAVLAAKTNYLLALGPLAAAIAPGEVASRIRLPVECADLLRSPETPPVPDRRYDLIVGNPPWQPLRALPGDRQAALARLAAAHGLRGPRGEMAPHVDLSALCAARAADTLLRPGGILAFVLPRTVLHADQHDPLRRGVRLSDGGTLRWREVWDCERSTAFPVPACVLFAKRTDSTDSAAPQGPLRVVRLDDRVEGPGAVEERQVAHLRLSPGRSTWEAGKPDSAPRPATSPYRDRFRQGATLVPRSFWFVRPAPQPEDGGGARDPADGAPVIAVETADTARRGPVAAYRALALRGCVPADRLYATALGDDLLPFGLRRLRPVLLPIEPDGERYRLAEEADDDGGRDGLSLWLREAARAWAAARGDKAGRMTLYQRLDRMRGLTAQNPRARFRVVYPNFQRISVAAVVASQEVAESEMGGACIPPAGFVVDTALYACETDDASEAAYLCACLNAPAIDRRLGALRRRDQGSHPNVHKKLFDVAPIPPYDPARAAHTRLAALHDACAARVRQALAEQPPRLLGPLAEARRHVRQALAPELTEIDALVESVLRDEEVTG